MRASTPRWFTPLECRDRARMRLFCFPCAGGGTSLYSAWRDSLPADIGLSLAELPGRECRLLDAPFTRLDDLTQRLADALTSERDGVPFAFFGHSMGALIAFEIARRLRRNSLALPCRLFVSACRAPHLPNQHAPVHSLPDAELRLTLAEFGGTPRELLDDDELMELVLPTLRADFTVCETYRYAHED